MTAFVVDASVAVKWVVDEQGSDEAALLDEGAEIIDDDFKTYDNLAYCTQRYMGAGWASVPVADIDVER